MKILLIASAFSHLWGSEPGVGWNWAMELARHHDVTVLTHGYFRDHMQAYTRDHGEPPFRVVFHDLAPLRDVPDTVYMNSTLHFLRWQWTSKPMVRRMLAQEPFDLIHHITLGTVRYPSFLQGLSAPLVAGPLGGGERAPMRLYAGLPWKIRLREMVRDLLIFSTRIDPMIWMTWGRTPLIICRTGETQAALPRHMHRRTLVIQEIGCPPPIATDDLPPPEASRTRGHLHALFVGRLLGLKGIHLALHAMARLKAQGIVVQLSLIGEGEAESALKALTEELGLNDQVHWLGKKPRHEVMAFYRQAEVMLFPSLHDSGGTVVLESISQGCPVVCLDLGGPPHFIDTSCGRVVPVGSRTQSEVIDGLADALKGLSELGTAELHALRQGCLTKALDLSWALRVERTYQQIRQRLDL